VGAWVRGVVCVAYDCHRARWRSVGRTYMRHGWSIYSGMPLAL